MNAIIGFSDILAEDELTESQQKHMNIIRDSSKNLLQIINDILDFSKIEAGKMKIEMIDASLNKIINNVKLMMSPAADRKKLNFEITYSPDLPAVIRTDPLRLQQCLINLITNALKFTEHGFIKLDVSLLQKEDDPYIEFNIEDSGIGIAPDKLKCIFDAFIQADGDITRKYGGTGLGLAIAKNLVSLLGGELTVISRVGKGSTFTITIPTNLNIDDQPKIDDPSVQTQEQSKELVKYDEEKFYGNILVVEDTETNQMLIRLLLEKLGLSVTIACNGKEGIQRFKETPYDLIFMDMHMPVMNGYDATKELRAMGIKTTIVALTASALKGDKEKCMSSGCDDYLSKPIDRKALLDILNKYMTKQRYTIPV
jgi:CheY-like chemotaxis protein/two-component sensor histidine kinase